MTPRASSVRSGPWLPAAGAAARQDDGYIRLTTSRSGTLHFRSPEQKEHFDVANVEVNVRGNVVFSSTFAIPNSAGASSKRATACSSAGTGRASVTSSRTSSRAPSDAQSACRIAARSDQIKDGEQTQVIFLKRQEYRTDLFGVGAIAFDLISCGRSSERFYESIRRFEFDGSTGEA